MKKVMLALAMLFVAANAFAADIDGKWTGSVNTPQGELPVQFIFKADGAVLTGNTLGPDGAALPIKDGKSEGSKVSFAVDFDFGGTVTTIAYSGVVAGTTLTMTLDFMGMPMEIVVKKAP